MLILSRRPTESLYILTPDNGPRIEVRVVAVRGQLVRIGIAAPHEYEVHREEVLERIDRERR